ncbi:hypothetical protein, partial [Edwardsiella tarda]|uniref:hypothetical protein n=1 Tax=Edwardsiella tarda TaxID=636 RepID=UPI0019685E6C
PCDEQYAECEAALKAYPSRRVVAASLDTDSAQQATRTRRTWGLFTSLTLRAALKGVQNLVQFFMSTAQANLAMKIA